jgi:hypothetical protein
VVTISPLKLKIVGLEKLKNSKKEERSGEHGSSHKTEREKKKEVPSDESHSKKKDSEKYGHSGKSSSREGSASSDAKSAKKREESEKFGHSGKSSSRESSTLSDAKSAKKREESKELVGVASSKIRHGEKHSKSIDGKLSKNRQSSTSTSSSMTSTGKSVFVDSSLHSLFRPDVVHQSKKTSQSEKKSSEKKSAEEKASKIMEKVASNRHNDLDLKLILGKFGEGVPTPPTSSVPKPSTAQAKALPKISSKFSHVEKSKNSTDSISDSPVTLSLADMLSRMTAKDKPSKDFVPKKPTSVSRSKPAESPVHVPKSILRKTSAQYSSTSDEDPASEIVSPIPDVVLDKISKQVQSSPLDLPFFQLPQQQPEQSVATKLSTSSERPRDPRVRAPNPMISANLSGPTSPTAIPVSRSVPLPGPVVSPISKSLPVESGFFVNPFWFPDQRNIPPDSPIAVSPPTSNDVQFAFDPEPTVTPALASASSSVASVSPRPRIFVRKDLYQSKEEGAQVSHLWVLFLS